MRWCAIPAEARLSRGPRRCSARARWLSLMLALGPVIAIAADPPAPALTVPLASMACDSGPYAVVLPRHYPTLHGIGRHQFRDLSVRPDGTGTLTHRRIDYTGLSLELQRRSADPDRYRLLALEVNSRRWNVGPLSVGRSPWRSIDEPALAGRNQDGHLELVGPKDSVRLVLRGGRVDSASYRCPPP